MKHTFLGLLGLDYVDPTRGMVHWWGGGDDSSSTDTSNDSSSDDSVGFFDDGGALESFFDSVGLDVDGDAADGVSGGVANLGDTDGDGRGEFAFTDNASNDDRNNIASGDVGVVAGITNVQDNIVNTTVSSNTNDEPAPISSNLSFDDAFAQAREELGPGETFEWNGETYSTAIAGEDPALDAALSETDTGGLSGDYYDKLVEAGGSDTSTLDELAAADTTGIDVYQPTGETVEAVEEYYSTGAGAIGATSDVDYSVTGSGEDYTSAAESDTADISGGVATGGGAPELNAVEKILVETYGWTDNGDGTLTNPYGGLYDNDQGGTITEEQRPGFVSPGYQPVEIETASDEERVVPEGMGVGDLYGYEDTVLEPGTGGLQDDVIELDEIVVTPEDAEQDIQDVINATPATGATIDPARLSDLESYVAELRSSMGSYTEADLDAAGFTADEIAAYEQLVAPGTLSVEDIAAIREQYGDLTLPQFNALEDTFGSYLGTMLYGSAGLTTEMAGNLLTALGDLDKKTLAALGYEMDEAPASVLGEGIVGTGQEMQEKFSEILQSRYPEEYVALNTPIIDPETGSINGDALRAKAIFSSLPTLVGLSGIPFGAVPAFVTGALATAGEIGTEARNEAYTQAIQQGFSEEEAEAIGRSANLTGAILGMPVGAASNLLLGGLIKPGAGATQILNMAGAIISSAVDEGYVEQNTIQTAVNAQFDGFDISDISFTEFSSDEAILGGFTGGAISVAAYAKAKARGLSDAEISEQIRNTPEGDTVTLKDANGAIVAQGSVPVSDVMFSGNPVEMRTDAEGNTSIVDTVTGASASMPAGTTLESGALTGQETTVADILASEILSGGANVSIGQDADGNITLTDNDTGLTTNVGGTLFYDAFGNMYETAAEAQTADQEYGLSGAETTVGDLEAKEQGVMGALGENVTINSRGDTIELTNEKTGFTVTIPKSGDVNIVDAVNSVQNNDMNAVADAGGSVLSVGTEASSLSQQDVEDTVNEILSGIPAGATSEEVSSAINAALSELDTVTPADVESIINESLANLDNISKDDVEKIVGDAVSGIETLDADTVQSLIDTSLSNFKTLTAEEVGQIVDTALGNLPESASPEEVSAAISEAISGLENISSKDVEDIVTGAIGELENISAEDVSTIVTNAIGELEILSNEDVTSIVTSAVTTATENLQTAVDTRIQELEDAGVTRQEAVDTALAELSTSLGTTEEALLESLGETKEGILETVGEQITGVETTLTEKILALEDAGVSRAEAVDAALAELASQQGITEENLLAEIGLTQEALTEKIGDVKTEIDTQIAGVEESILNRVTELEEAGLSRDEALQTSIEEVASDLNTTSEVLLESIGTTQETLTTQLEALETGFETSLGEVTEAIDTSNMTLSQIVALMEEEKRKEEEYLQSLEGEPELDTTPDYTGTVVDTTVPGTLPPQQVQQGIAAAGVRPTVAPYYQAMQTGDYSFYRPEPDVDQETPGPVFQDPVRYLAPTSSPLYGYGYIAPNMDIARITRLAQIQGTGAEQLASEELINE